jgi:hypothetical protein
MSFRGAHHGLIGLVILLVTGVPAMARQVQNSPPAAAPAAVPSETPPAQTGSKVVEQGLFPRSFAIPGTDLSLAIGGYVKVDFIQDFSGIGDAFEFKTNSIPIDGTAAAEQSGRTTIHARESRFSLDLRSSGTGQHHFRAFVEGDFFGDGNAFRLRHAYGEFGPFLGGQTWSTFQDISARPLTVDFEGPDGEVFVRQAMVRFSKQVTTNWSFAVAAENPTPQFVVPSDVLGTVRASMPDIPGFVRYQRGAGHVQVAGLIRQIRFDSTGDLEDTSAAGWGINTTFVAPILGSFRLLGQFAMGEGTARYIEGISGQNLDALLSTAGELETVAVRSGNIGFIHQWAPKLKTGFSFSTTVVDDEPGLTPSTIERLMDVRVNLFYTPYRQVDFAGELLWGERRNQDSSSGDAWRLTFATIFRLN